jgi:hypothetical protein
MVAESGRTEQLLSGAVAFAQSGLRARLDGDSMVYLLHVSTALELLAKAFLASLDGSLIAAGDFDSLLHGCDQSKHARTPASRMRTITMTDTLKRVGQVLPAIENLKASLQLLADVRNGVVHAGTLESGADEAALVPFLKACDHLLPGVDGADREIFWGDLASMVDARLSDSLKAAEVVVADALASARLTFERRYASLDDATRDGVLSGIESSYSVTKYEEDLVDCPACGRRALTQGSYEVEWEADYDVEGGEGFVSAVHPVVTYSPGYLSCRVCDLELDGEEELSPAGVAPLGRLRMRKLPTSMSLRGIGGSTGVRGSPSGCYVSAATKAS